MNIHHYSPNISWNGTSAKKSKMNPQRLGVGAHVQPSPGRQPRKQHSMRLRSKRAERRRMQIAKTGIFRISWLGMVRDGFMKGWGCSHENSGRDLPSLHWQLAAKVGDDFGEGEAEETRLVLVVGMTRHDAATNNGTKQKKRLMLKEEYLGEKGAIKSVC